MVWGIYRVGGGSDRYENLVLALRFEIFRVPRNRMLRSDRYFGVYIEWEDRKSVV